MSEGNGKSARDKAKAARLAAEAANKRRERLIRILGGGVVVVIVAAIIVAALISSNKGTVSPSASASPNPSAPLPNDVNSSTYAYQVTKSPAAGIPLVQVWEDFQCPACKQYEGAFAQGMYAAAAGGTINMQLRPTTFLDARFPGSDNTSARATSAWGCAIDAGKPLEYHSALFAAQTTPEGTPLTQQQLIDIGKQVGITGPKLDAFTSCVNARTYEGWAANSAQIFEQDKVPGTPTVYVNGKELPLKGISTPEQLLTKIKSMAA